MQLAQPICDRVRAIVVESETIDQRVLLWQSEDPRLRISRLRFCSHGPDFDETEPERRPRWKSNAVFI